MQKTFKLIFLCGARDFHAMDWYFSAKNNDGDKNIQILTDLISGEGFQKLIDSTDNVNKLFVIDKLLFKNQSSIGNIWRNLIKFLVLPIQIFLVKRYHKKNPNSIYWAHSMYYIWLAWLSGVKYIGTPQGSDILIKPFKSKIFKWFSVKSIKKAEFITVDSEKMQEICFELSNVKPYIIQNGIDVNAILNLNSNHKKNEFKILSIRGLTPLYRIENILKSKSNSIKYRNVSLDLIYPFYDQTYIDALNKIQSNNNRYIGRVSRYNMYDIMSNSELTISIPFSDSSPRSVYEAIFCNSVVAITYHKYYDTLPKCMKERIIIIDINDPNWFDYSIEKSLEIKKCNYVPSEEALELFDQNRSYLKVKNLIINYSNI